MDPRQFAFALQLGSAASTYRMPMKSPAEEGLTLVYENGKTERIRFKDVPINRFAMAVRDHFSADVAICTSVMMRYLALRRIWKHERMKPWIKKHEEDPHASMVHEAVFVAGATLPVNEEYWFDEDAFFAKVEETARLIDAEEAKAQ